MKISIAHATRRPAKALEIRAEWLKAAAHPEDVEYLFGIDEDDAESLRVLANEPHTVATAGGGCVMAFNQAFAATSGEIIIGGCDDMYPIPNWDTILAERFGDVSRPLIMLTGDGVRSDRLATLPIITRAWYKRFGYLFPPQFTTVGPDIWLTERASRDGCLIHATDLIFEHRHPYYGKAPMDDVYAKQNAQAKYEEAYKLLDELLEPLPISLCMIVGNEAAVIERCLESAKGAFDELCLVRAIGDSKPDATLPLADDWCAANGKKCRIEHYDNKTPGLNHVDDFAAARNQSFALATGYWCLWLDADDLLDEVNCKRIRNAASNTRFDAQSFRYVMPTGGEFFRERLIKRGKGRWQDPVHETCVVKESGNAPQIEIHHAPLGDKSASSAARNLTILEGPLKRTPRQLFYYHEELVRLGRNKEALVSAHAALAILPPEMVTERYEIFLNLIDLDSANTEKWAFEAIKTDPCRREAFAYLTQCALNCGEVLKAVQYFKFLNAVSMPNPKPATHRGIWYGWARNYLGVMVLRAIGKTEQADKDHAEYLKDPTYAAGVSQHSEGQ